MRTLRASVVQTSARVTAGECVGKRNTVQLLLLSEELHSRRAIQPSTAHLEVSGAPDTATGPCLHSHAQTPGTYWRSTRMLTGTIHRSCIVQMLIEEGEMDLVGAITAAGVDLSRMMECGMWSPAARGEGLDHMLGDLMHLMHVPRIRAVAPARVVVCTSPSRRRRACGAWRWSHRSRMAPRVGWHHHRAVHAAGTITGATWYLRLTRAG